MTDRFDGCYNCNKRSGRTCEKFPKGIIGDGPCELHELMTAFRYGKTAESAFRALSKEAYYGTNRV